VFTSKDLQHFSMLYSLKFQSHKSYSHCKN